MFAVRSFVQVGLEWVGLEWVGRELGRGKKRIEPIAAMQAVKAERNGVERVHCGICFVLCASKAARLRAGGGSV